MSCIVPGCPDIADIEITDATFYPEKYNGKKICKIHDEERKYMQENDVVSKDEQDGSLLSKL